MRFEPATHLTGRCLVIARDHIDTDQIIPARFLYRSRKDGFQGLLFHDFLSQLTPHEAQGLEGIIDTPDVVNPAPKILVAGENFGCGSSREHAVWSLLDNGVKAVIARSFGDIFYGNAINNGLAVLRVGEDWASLVRAVMNRPEVKIDIAAGTIRGQDQALYRFEMDDFFRNMLMQGLQEVDMTLTQIDKIKAYESRTAHEYPWLQKPSMN